MKNNDFSSVPSGRTRRAGQSPNIGKLTRSPQSATRRRRSRRGQNASKSSTRTSLLWGAALGTVALVGMVIFFVVSYFQRPDADIGKTAALGAAVALPQRQSKALKTLGEEASLKLVRSALELKDPGQVEEYFVLSTPREPAEAIRLLEEYEESTPIESYLWLGGKLVNNGYMEEVLVNYKTPGRELNRVAQIWNEPDGSWRIDFDAYARHVSPDWPTINSGKAPVSVVRVFIMEDNYYNGVFADESKWQGYSLVSPDSEEILFGYSLRESPQHRAITEILKAEASVHPVTLEITKTPDSGPRQFEISRVLAENWSIRPQSFDGL